MCGDLPRLRHLEVDTILSLLLMIFPVKSKNEVLGIFLKWKAQVENQMGRKIKVLRSDNGGEYKSDPFQDVCQECGIVRHFTLDPRAKKALFMGFSAGVKGYRLWCLESKKTIVSRDVTFDESSMLNKVNPNSSDTSQQVEYTPKQVEFEEAVVIPTTNTTNDSHTEEEESDDEEVPPQEPSQQSESIAVRRTRRENKKPARFADMVAYALPVVDDVPYLAAAEGGRDGVGGNGDVADPVGLAVPGVGAEGAEEDGLGDAELGGGVEEAGDLVVGGGVEHDFVEEGLLAVAAAAGVLGVGVVVEGVVGGLAEVAAAEDEAA
ncbi:hypothetical protein SASPL_121675 [Salvia splendens]|uniref:Retroviral polymerase SH3-like domain-containing protein n=1 Tax=Salvia splendens TaxID=180675 RepID=A0A8X8XSW6_SALSN|nr:hypothetical protein SASPL_121675 [Salvia splendens]